jgi:hypothetical protein
MNYGNLNDNVVRTLKPKVSPLKKELLDLGISVAVAARYVNRSYTYLINQLNGLQRLQPHTEKKLRQLIETVCKED